MNTLQHRTQPALTQASRRPAAPRQSLLPDLPSSIPPPPEASQTLCARQTPPSISSQRTGCVGEVDGRQSSEEGGSGWDHLPLHRTRMRRRPISDSREWTTPCPNLVPAQLGHLRACTPGHTNASPLASCTCPPAPQPTQGSPIGRSTKPPACPASSPWPGSYGLGF